MNLTLFDTDAPEPAQQPATPQRRPVPRLTLQRRGRRDWWIVGLPSPDWPEAGPYSTRTEANDDRRGLRRYYRFGHRRSFVTVEKPTRRKRTKIIPATL